MNDKAIFLSIASDFCDDGKLSEQSKKLLQDYSSFEELSERMEKFSKLMSRQVELIAQKSEIDNLLTEKEKRTWKPEWIESMTKWLTQISVSLVSDEHPREKIPEEKVSIEQAESSSSEEDVESTTNRENSLTHFCLTLAPEITLTFREDNHDENDVPDREYVLMVEGKNETKRYLFNGTRGLCLLREKIGSVVPT